MYYPAHSAAALNVTEPLNCGVGGDIFCLYWDAKSNTMKGINGSGRSPKALNLAKARELGIKGREMYDLVYLLRRRCN